MRIYHNIDEFTAVKNAVVTIGTFDGVHIGHRKIISRIKELAAATGGETVILTFFPHPRMILHPEDESIKLINTINEKAELLEQLGVDHLIITPFSRDFSNQTAEGYIRDVLVNKIGTKTIVIGYDHRFGKDRQGGLRDLLTLGPQYNFEVVEIPEQDINDVAISSTRIRAALLDNNINIANECLGYPFFITGKVIRGDQLGRQLGYPTANLLIEEKYKLIPADGIFAVKVKVAGNEYSGMAYIGHRPTINGMTRNIEVNIFDFKDEIYNQQIRMEFLHFVRADIKFESLDQLVVQLGKDKQDVQSLLVIDGPQFNT
ncbi:MULTISPECIES: bifunctional riboflavin kinase/FAD synthetase [unclassified Mucilaginibacter]|uniref:bifunctional riboflavin kinase/FAD synthetase n=1 Tax=unclassified Mucilaginibacter TaxID=2617802 RepID=UPI002AC8F488|nr:MULTISPECIES: bifunctional riboflavin kinase/FAD synthetase [unclassified Mucilaginibacter]MEB0261189.1 bifunctional riboflavin kinase/FAD synthetase [Mucilaginibacter sp. 10I4]MEB0280362.1 bifunctional riboflavin kinase/FAD synthetase [Mucilaginibacter sp. 10B2]MEB0300383.1 bifunctional riboflavin kinase/FAD synthetase [Mucilaginibacter sp. 5C4]WPX24547.1 bifunctional riboflavin kinase/FAD synthetase [Mucilaginibacter sp. 5C4]